MRMSCSIAVPTITVINAGRMNSPSGKWSPELKRMLCALCSPDADYHHEDINLGVGLSR
jgi:hypothetical protein